VPLEGDIPWGGSASMFPLQPLPAPWIDREDEESKTLRSEPAEDFVPYTVLTGVLVLGFFFASLITIMVVRGVVPDLPVLFRFFGNIFLAGTIIVGIFNRF
jgi:hypothetical protein